MAVCTTLAVARSLASTDSDVELQAMVYSVLHGPKWRNPPDLLRHMPGLLKSTFSVTSQVRESVSRSVRLRSVLVQSPLTAPSSVLNAFIMIKLASCHLLLYVVYMYQKIIKFYGCIQLLQAKMKVGPFLFGPPCKHPLAAGSPNHVTCNVCISSLLSMS